MGASNSNQALDRLNRVFNGIAQANIENQRVEAWNEYYRAFDVFYRFVVARINQNYWPVNWNPLLYPNLFFYLRDPKSSCFEIHTIDYFPYGQRQRSNRITPKTFPYFLQNQCILPLLPSDMVGAMYQALEQLMRNYPRSRLEVLLEHLKRYDPEFSAYISLGNCYFLSKEKNLYFKPQQYMSGYDPVLTMSTQKLPATLLKRVFRMLYEQLDEDRQYIQSEPPRIPYTAVFSHGLGGKVYRQAKYQAGSDSFEVTDHTRIALQLKHTPLTARFSHVPVPDSLHRVFHALCGDRTAPVDELARFISAAMDPGLSGMTIIHAPAHCEKLSSALGDLFWDCTAALGISVRKNALSPLPSLNQLVKDPALRMLFTAQHENSSVVFVRDIPVSERSLRTARALVTGRRIKLSSPHLPPQSFYNRLHFVCVTDDRARAEGLKKQLKTAVLIDLSVCERAEPLPQLTPSDREWIRTKFVLYGLKLRTLSHLEMADPCSRAESQQAPDLASEIAAFLKACVYGKGLYCDTEQLFDGFCAFYAGRHEGMQPPTTKIKFNKEVRFALGVPHSRAVTYQKLRIRGPLKPRWYYVGLDLPAMPPPVKESGSELLNYLAHINTYGLKNDFEPVYVSERPLPSMERAVWGVTC